MITEWLKKYIRFLPSVLVADGVKPDRVDERIQLLDRAVELVARYADVLLKTQTGMRTQIRGKLLTSWSWISVNSPISH